jgi:hypothetical protein
LQRSRAKVSQPGVWQIRRSMAVTRDHFRLILGFTDTDVRFSTLKAR